jgi:hypothetical protein
MFHRVDLDETGTRRHGLILPDGDCLYDPLHLSRDRRPAKRLGLPGRTYAYPERITHDLRSTYRLGGARRELRRGFTGRQQLMSRQTTPAPSAPKMSSMVTRLRVRLE